MAHDIEMLISRVVDEEATDHDWQDLRERAASDPSIWRDVAEAQRDHVAVRTVMAYGMAVADRVDVGHRRRSLDFRFGGWIGWAVAAVVTMAWVARIATTVRPAPVPATTHTAGFGGSQAPFDTPVDALQAYFRNGEENGEIIGEIPTKVLLESRPTEDGGYELLYLRQFLERAVVHDLYEFGGQNEIGQPSLVPWQKPGAGGAL